MTALALGFLIGSIPVAFLLVRWRHALDLRREGSSNIGAMNSYEVTGSRLTGVLVMLLDALKGAAAVALAMAIGDRAGGLSDFWAAAAGLAGAVAGHNYNPWLSLASGRLEGGKGLATAAGGLLLLLPLLVPVWVAVFVFGWWLFGVWRGEREVIPGNVLATLVFPVAGLALYGAPGGIVGLALALLVLPKHVAQMRALLRP